MVAYYRNLKDMSDCYSLTDAYTPLLNASFEMFNETNSKNETVNYLVLTYKKTNSSACKDASVQFKMMCDANATTPQYAWESMPDDNCSEVIRFTSANNCNKYDINTLWRWCD